MASQPRSYPHRQEPGSRKRPQGQSTLTQRELEIVATVISGYANKDIAQHLKISECTVKHHLTNIFDKLGVDSRLELALVVLRTHFRDIADVLNRQDNRHILDQERSLREQNQED